jgi:O-antigen ligase
VQPEGNISRSALILKCLLLVGAVYFLAIAIVHMLRIKIPLLFVYYDVPSYGYQDRIISFLSFGWSVFLFTASVNPAKNREAVKAVLIAGFTGILGLNVINSTTDFHTLAPGIDPAVFKREVLVLSAYEAALIVCYFMAKREKTER